MRKVGSSLTPENYVTVELTKSRHSDTVNKRRRDGRMNMTDQYQTREGVLVLMNQIFNAKNITKIGTWNFRTLYQDGRLSQVLWEMEAYRLDVFGISEIRWIDQDQTINNGVTI